MSSCIVGLDDTTLALDEPVTLQFLGPYLRRIREAAGLETSDLARDTGIAKRRVEAIEAGAEDVTFLEVAELAHLLGHSVDEVLAALHEQSRADLQAASRRGQGRVQ
jgi:transcriptional regulator with XRE-family HTH domain